MDDNEDIQYARKLGIRESKLSKKDGTGTWGGGGAGKVGRTRDLRGVGELDGLEGIPSGIGDERRDILGVLGMTKGGEERRKGPDVLRGAEPSVYERLMAKERRVLDTIDRVVESQEREEDVPPFELPVWIFLARVGATIDSIVKDLINMGSRGISYRRTKRIFTKGDRMFYLGFFLSVVSLFIMVTEWGGQL